MRMFKDVFYLFAPHLFANPSSCYCYGRRGQENGGQKNEKQEQPANALAPRFPSRSWRLGVTSQRGSKKHSRKSAKMRRIVEDEDVQEMSSIFLPLIFLPTRLLVLLWEARARKWGAEK